MKQPKHFTLLSFLIISMIFAACTPPVAPATETGADGGEETEAAPDEETEAAPDEATATEEASTDDGDRVQIRWFVGLGAGSDEPTFAPQQAVVDEFNASQD